MVLAPYIVALRATLYHVFASPHPPSRLLFLWPVAKISKKMH
jgi:hypothetical protein